MFDTTNLTTALKRYQSACDYYNSATGDFSAIITEIDARIQAEKDADAWAIENSVVGQLNHLKKQFEAFKDSRRGLYASKTDVLEASYIADIEKLASVPVPPEISRLIGKVYTATDAETRSLQLCIDDALAATQRIAKAVERIRVEQGNIIAAINEQCYTPTRDSIPRSAAINGMKSDLMRVSNGC